jgi:hypothetical protein
MIKFGIISTMEKWPLKWFIKNIETMFNTFNLKMLIVKTNLFKKITRILKTKSAKNYN